MIDNDVMIIIVGLLAATLRVSTPLILGTIGELFCEKSGVLNLGIEGTMVIGAFTGFIIGDATGSVWLGVIMSLIAGALAGFLMSLMTVRLGVNQHVSGLGITLLLTAIASFGYRARFGTPITPPSIPGFSPLPILPDDLLLSRITNQFSLTYIAFLLIPVVWLIINKTKLGLQIRAVGENPEALDAAGINVYRTRTTALMIGGAFMALAGAFLSLAQVGAYTYGMIAGRGWICIALIIFANWKPSRILWGALLFGGASALQLRLQSLGIKVPYELFLALPYLVTIAALGFAGRNVSAPSALLKAYRRE